MVVAECVDADAAEQIEIAIALLIDDVYAFAAYEEDGAPVVSGEQQPRFRGANLFEFRHPITS
jgi:hypothetical protein